jgi:hypothetical protein
MTIDHYKKIEDEKVFLKLAAFVVLLKRKGVPICRIDTNDWSCNTMPGVYVHRKSNYYDMRRYCRCAAGDVEKAIKYYNS